MHTTNFELWLDHPTSVIPLLDGRQFPEILREHELAHQVNVLRPLNWKKQELPRLTSGDPALGLDVLGWRGGDTIISPLPLRTRERVLLLVCGCGEPGCSSTEVDMEVTDDRVIWSNLRTYITKYEPYPNFGPWIFDRAQYESECRRAHDSFAAFVASHPKSES
jgi:hypothetical protein